MKVSVFRGRQRAATRSTAYGGPPDMARGWFHPAWWRTRHLGPFVRRFGRVQRTTSPRPKQSWEKTGDGTGPLRSGAPAGPWCCPVRERSVWRLAVPGRQAGQGCAAGRRVLTLRCPTIAELDGLRARLSVGKATLLAELRATNRSAEFMRGLRKTITWRRRGPGRRWPGGRLQPGSSLSARKQSCPLAERLHRLLESARPARPVLAAPQPLVSACAGAPLRAHRDAR